MYCLRCKRHTETANETAAVLRNGRPAKKGTCAVCGAKKCQIQSTKAGGSVLNRALNALPLPEMHMKLPKGVTSEAVLGGTFQDTGKYSYCGPFTKLDKRLLQGYRGVNSLDRACLNHDVAYAVHSDTAGRNAADDVLAAAASKIALDENVPDWEKKDARTVTAIMSAKSRLGLGVGTAKQRKATRDNDSRSGGPPALRATGSRRPAGPLRSSCRATGCIRLKSLQKKAVGMTSE